MNSFPILIGYDPREDIAFDVCRYSLMKRSSIPLHVRGLKQDPLRHAQLYRRQWEWRGDQRVDLIDDRPFSTEFSFTRFLVPALCMYSGWALFCDCDMLFLSDVAELLPYMDESKAVVVAQQNYTLADAVKMDGAANQKYPRKGWSAFTLWNCGHPANQTLVPREVNERSGSWLHGFSWLKDEEIGALPAAWNWMPGMTPGVPKVVHYTLGGCWFPGYEHVAFANEWREVYNEMMQKQPRKAA